MDQTFNVAWDEDGILEALTLSLADEVFALEAHMVQEILDPLTETFVPGSPPMVSSIINFRGRVIPLADLHSAFCLPQTEKTVDSRIVVIECSLPGHTTLMGLKADCVYEVTKFLRNTAEEAPTVGMRWPQQFIRCLIRSDGRPIIVPDLHNIFLELCGRGRPATMSLH